MANYQRCKLRIYPQSGSIDSAQLESKIQRLKKENNIYETIFIYHEREWKFVEIRFTAKRFPDMLEDIFNTDEFNI